MAVEEFLLFALAAIYFVIPYGSPGEHGQKRGAREEKSRRHKHVGSDAVALVLGLLSAWKRRGHEKAGYRCS
jgi:hypothetical protein